MQAPHVDYVDRAPETLQKYFSGAKFIFFFLRQKKFVAVRFSNFKRFQSFHADHARDG